MKVSTDRMEIMMTSISRTINDCHVVEDDFLAPVRSFGIVAGYISGTPAETRRRIGSLQEAAEIAEALNALELQVEGEEPFTASEYERQVVGLVSDLEEGNYRALQEFASGKIYSDEIILDLPILSAETVGEVRRWLQRYTDDTPVVALGDIAM